MPPAEPTILQVSPSDIGGGAEKVAADLHRSYLTRGLDAWLAVARDHGSLSNTLTIPRSDRRSAWTRTLMRRADALSRDRGDRKGALWVADRALRVAADPARITRMQRGLEDFGYPATAGIPDLAPRPVDVLHLHNLHGSYFDIRALPELTARVPTFMTMHDVWLLTGHCAYPMECERWTVGCGECPALDRYSPIRRDASAANLAVKRAAVRASRLHMATPSRWLEGLVARSGIAQDLADLRVIANGVDTAVFAPGDRAAARERTGLPAGATVVMYAALRAKSSEFKGFDTLESALPAIARAAGAAPLLMLAVGQDAPETRIGEATVRFVPFLDDPAAIADLYRSADLYLHPARAENLPLAVIEAMACGTPVVASDAGGIPEIVMDGETGRLFAVGDADGLARCAIELIGDADLRGRYAAAGVERVRERFTLERQTDAYLAWYDEVRSGASG